MAITITVE